LKNPEALPITLRPGVTTTALVYRPDRDLLGAVLILGHGAGAGQYHPWIVECAHALAALGLETVTFNFLYTEQRRRVPDRRPLLDECYRAVIETLGRQTSGAGRPLFIGGKSMGGRIATHVAADDPNLDVRGLVLLGYPLHPPGQPEKRRDAHLPAVGRPMLFVQGSRDTFGTPSELQPVLDGLRPRPALHVIDGGDHSFKIGPKNPARQAALLSEARVRIVDWIRATTLR
jgi:hypothetical protein